MTDIREAVARALDPEAWALMDEHRLEYSRCCETLDIADAAITAFLETAAEQGWHMRPDDATTEMGRKSGLVDRCVCGCRITQWGVKSYSAMLEAAPPFEWDK